MKSYIVWYRDNSADDVPGSTAHRIVSGKTAAAAKRMWKLLYPNDKIVRMKVWH